MNSKKIKLANSIATATGLNIDRPSGMVFGTKNNYWVIIKPYDLLTIEVSVNKNGELPNPQDLNDISAISPSIINCSVNSYNAVYTVRTGSSSQNTAENTLEALNALTHFLSTNGFVSCCKNCGASDKGMGAYNVKGAGEILCPYCFSATQQAADFTNPDKSHSDNIFLGTIGAFLGSLIGAALIIVLGRLNFVASFSGLVVAICALKGYEKLGGYLSHTGIVISVFIMVIIVFVSNQIDYAITISQYYGVSLWESFCAIPSLLLGGYLSMGSYAFNLGLLYLFTAWGAIPTIKNSSQSVVRLNSFYKM